MNRLVILTGASGSGLSSAKYVFEEAGFYIVENAPVDIIPSLLDSFDKRGERIHDFCLILNIVTAKRSIALIKADKRFKTRLIVLMASQAELIKRYALTRHAHVRSVIDQIPLEEAIERDIADADAVAVDADVTLDTSALSVKLLHKYVNDFIDINKRGRGMHVSFVSFGFKNGTPSGLDMIFDVRSIPNPYWVEGLKELTGYDKPVIDYMEQFPQTRTLLNRITTFLSSQLSEMEESGRTNYNVGVACSGGQHRSTYVAKYLKDYFSDRYMTKAIHRDTPNLNDDD